jgi:hypothetical protein
MIFKKLKKTLSRIYGARKAKRILVIAEASSNFSHIEDAAQLDMAFIWADAPQGHGFWSEVHLKLSQAKLLEHNWR